MLQIFSKRRHKKLKPGLYIVEQGAWNSSDLDHYSQYRDLDIAFMFLAADIASRRPGNFFWCFRCH